MDESAEQKDLSKSVIEYQSLRLEIIERIKLRQQLTISSLLLTATLLGIGLGEPKIALIYPPLIVFIAFAWSQNDYSIQRMSKYIRANFENLNPENYGWENYVANKRLNKLRFIVISHNGLFVITQVMAIIIGVLGSLKSGIIDLESWLLIIIDIICVLVILLFIVLSHKTSNN